MTDRPHDPPSDAAEPADQAVAADAAPVVAPSPGDERRAYLRQLSGDAVVTVGRLAGLSSAVGRSLSAAGGSVLRGLSTMGEATGADQGQAAVPVVAEDADQGTAAPDATNVATPNPPPAPDPMPSSLAAADPVRRLTAEQHAFLVNPPAATLAINDPPGPPHLGTCRPAWDGSTFRIPSQLFGARATLVEKDPIVSLLIEAPATGAWVMIACVAVLEDPRPIDESVVIALTPTRFVWRPPTRG